MDRGVSRRLLSVGICGVLVVGAAAIVAARAGREAPAAAPAEPSVSVSAGCPSPDRLPDGACAALPAGRPLRQLAEARGIRLGAAVDASALSLNAAYRTALARQFGGVTAENAMKWGAVEPTRGVRDHTAADELVRFADRNGQAVYGHTLVWHRQLPAWLTPEAFTPTETATLLRNYVEEEVSYFRGRVWAWDVVNEPLDEDGSLRDTIWSRALGEDYIADAFRWARAADPNAVLFLNDYNIEGVNAKSDALYRLVRELLADGVPVQGIGFQTHWRLADLPASFAENMRRFTALGLKVAITELDVRIPLPATPKRLAAQADVYAEAVETCLSVAGCVAVTVWGFSDLYSWVPSYHPGSGDAAILDRNFAPKPAYQALAAALGSDRPRRRR